MASSGSITTGTKEGRSVTLSWSLSSQDIANNTSTIAWTLKGSGSGSGWVMSGGFKAVINGTTVYSTSTDNRIQLYNGTVIASGSLKISHNADGTKSFKLSCEAGVYSYAVNVSASGTHTLNTIPRASSVSATSVNIGSATTISISRASSSFTHTLSYTFGSAKGTIATKTASTSVSWTPALTLANQIPSTTSGTCTITCDTYNGSTKIGTKTCTLTLTVPASVKPTISSLTVSRIDGDVPSTWGIYVQSKSKAKSTCHMKYVRDDDIKAAFVTMLNKLIYGHRLILAPYLKALENSSGDEAIQRIQHLELLLDQNSEQRETLTKLMAQGYIDQILYNQETNALLLQAETYRSDIEAITICMTGDSAKVTETNLLLHFVSHADMLTNYSEELFESYADHIEISGRNEIRFVMKCGLTFTERIGD